MQIQKTPNGWSCLLVAFAMAIDEPFQTLINEIGHDGSEKIWLNLPEPYCRRSFHPQEIIDCCFKRNILVTEIERYPISRPGGHEHATPYFIFDQIPREQRFNSYVQTFSGVLLDSSHAVAWDGMQLFDPKGYIINKFEPKIFFGVHK